MSKSVQEVSRLSGNFIVEYAHIRKIDNKRTPMIGYYRCWAETAKASPICIDDMDAMFSETKSKFIAQLKARDISESPIFASGAWTAGNVDLEPITKYLTNAKVVWVGKE